MSASDPGCVKTHTLKKCRKYNSPTRHPSACRKNHQFSGRAISPKCFYARSGRWSFYTAKTHFGHREHFSFRSRGRRYLSRRNQSGGQSPVDQSLSASAQTAVAGNWRLRRAANRLIIAQCPTTGLIGHAGKSAPRLERSYSKLLSGKPCRCVPHIGGTIHDWRYHHAG